VSKRFLLVDGTNIALFASFGGDIPPERSTRSAVNAIEHAAQLAGATHLIVAMDGEQPTFRKEIAADYKAGRITKTQPYVHALRAACESQGWLTLTAEGFEADDTVATLAFRLTAQQIPVVIFTGDSDALALVDPLVTVFRPVKIRECTVWNQAAVFEKYGVHPHQLADYKALIGESGDNIAGVPGIGRKKAVRLLNEYGSLNAMLDTIPRLRSADLENVKKHRELALRALSLIALRLDVPIGELRTSLCIYRSSEPDRG
jgi:DNA polymerase-1